MVVLQGLRDPRFNLINSCHIRGVRRKKFRNGLLRPETNLADHLPWAPAHPLPERDGFARIIAGLCHQSQPNIVRFGLLLSAERQGDAHSIGTHRGNRRVRTLAPRELVVAGSRSGAPRFATHNLKWRGTYRRRWKATYRYARNLPPGVSARVSATVERAFRLLNIDGPARFDLKLTAEHRIFVLDVNPNPPMSRQDEFVLAAKKSGIDYLQLMRLLLSSAKARRCP